MKTLSPPAVLITVAILFPWSSPSADLAHAKDGSGVYGYHDTPVQPWSGFRVHDPDRPAPQRVNPGNAGLVPLPSVPPSDAIVLFNGPDLNKWQPTDWRIVDGVIEAAGTSNLISRELFGNIQLHLEWWVPLPGAEPWYNRGNNGLMLMGLYEIQIFDSYTEKIYPDGQAAAIYAQTPPLVNACRKPGEWQTFDVIFFAPVFEGDKLVKSPRVTVFHNGLLAQFNEEIRGETNHRVLPQFKAKLNRGPVKLAGHHCPVRFRNIWVRPL